MRGNLAERGARASAVARLARQLAVAVLASAIIACGSAGRGDGGDVGSGDASDGDHDGAGGSEGAAAGGTTVSCIIMQASAGNPPAVMKTCMETANLSAPAVEYLRAGCMTPADAGSTAQQQFAIAPCSHDHAVGGCSTLAETGAVTRWWYEGDNFTANDIRALCQAIGAMFVAP